MEGPFKGSAGCGSEGEEPPEAVQTSTTQGRGWKTRGRSGEDAGIKLPCGSGEKAARMERGRRGWSEDGRYACVRAGLQQMTGKHKEIGLRVDAPILPRCNRIHRFGCECGGGGGAGGLLHRNRISDTTAFRCVQ